MAETIYTKIRGVTNANENGTSRQELIKKYVNKNSIIFLKHEPDNPYNPNAIRVCIFDDNYELHTIGYLSDDLADQFHDQVGRIECYVQKVTGEDGESLGVNLCLVIETDEDTEPEEEDEDQEYIFKPILKNKPKTPPPAPPKPRISPKSRTTALILCIFLGIFGGHHFYAGRSGFAWVYVFTVGLAGFGWIIDIFLISVGVFTDKSGRPISKW